MANNPSPEKQSLFRRTFVTINSYRDYRLVWFGSWTEHLTEWMETTALLWLVNQLTHSPVYAALMITLRSLPMIFFSPIGGVIADRFDRRRVLTIALLFSAAISIALAVVVHTGAIQPWHLLVYSVLVGVATSFNHPARSTLIPNLVRKEHYLNAITLDNASVTASRIVGAPLAGIIIGLAGTTPVLGLKAIGAFSAVFWLSRIHPPPTPMEARKSSAVHNFAEGLRYVGKNRGVLSQVLLYLLPIFVTNTYTGLLPYIATDYLHIGPDLYGFLNAAPGLGAVMTTVVLAATATRRKSLWLLVGGITQGLALIFFAFSSVYLLSLLLLVVIGGAHTAFMTLNNTMIQEMVSDQVRGRVMAFREVAFGLGPAGSLASGAAASAFGISLALGTAGGAAILILLGIMVIPQARAAKLSASAKEF